MNISTDIETNKLHFDAVFCTERNFDLKKRELIIAGKESVLYMIDGFLRSDVLEKILEKFSSLREGEADFEKDFFEKNRGGDFFYLTTKGQKNYTDVSFPDNAYIIFCREDAGIPEEILVKNPDTCLRIPMRSEARSLNLSNTVAIVTYEVLRQWEFPDLQWEGQLTKYNW